MGLLNSYSLPRSEIRRQFGKSEMLAHQLLRQAHGYQYRLKGEKPPFSPFVNYGKKDGVRQ